MAKSNGLSHILAELSTLDELSTFMTRSTRLKFTCVAVCKKYIALGSNTGGVYLFSRDTLKYLQVLFADTESSQVVCLSLSPSDHHIGFALSSGHVAVYELNIEKRTKPERVRLTQDHVGSTIKSLVWDSFSSKLFVGDSSGKLSIVYVPSIKGKTLFSGPSEVIAYLDACIYQMEWWNEKLLVSTFTHTHLFDNINNFVLFILVLLYGKKKMSAPLKPWERPGVNYQNTIQFPVNNMSASPISQERLTAGLGNLPAASVSFTSPPPVPPRPSQQPTFNNRPLGYGGYGGYNNFSGYNNYSSPYGFGGYSGLYSNPYSSLNYNRMGEARSGFAQHAEESSRPAFESIETIVYAVNSVGMMLDSTFQAVTLRYIYRKLLEILRLSPKGEADRLWKIASSEMATISHGGNYSFQGQGSEELSFTAGQNIIIAPKELQPQVRGWLLASVDGQKTGMVPANYVSILGKRKGSRHTNQTQQPLVNSDSSSTLVQESQSIQQGSNLPESQLESAFCENSKQPTYLDELGQEVSNKSAVDILDEMDK
ncbi:Peroxisomal membrane protein PAS20 [Bulinus truncatus]|nr:Peroxisomal membrane protein PAS20 [Bulinus truncatus]